MKSQFAYHISQSYSQHAEKYVSVLEPTLAPLAEEMAQLANLQPGQRALDLATGTGLIARSLAETSAVVIGADLSPGIIKLARSQSHGEIPLSTADAHRLPFEDECFDLVTCGLSLSHFSEVERALEEIRRALRPGGRLVASAWGSEKHNPSKDAANRVRARYLPDRETAFGGRLEEDLWADPDRGCRTLERAGFVEVQVSTSTLSGRYADHATAALVALAWPLTRYQVAQLSSDEQEKLMQETESAVKNVPDLSWWIEVRYYQATQPAI